MELNWRRQHVPGCLRWLIGIVFVVAAFFACSAGYLLGVVYPMGGDARATRLAAQIAGLTPDATLLAETLPDDIAGPQTLEPLPTLSDTRRRTILVMGMDRRGGETFSTRTDTLILVSIHPLARRAALLSLPRDLYVAIPGHGEGRINTAFQLGAQRGGAAGGAKLAIDTVEQNLGVNIDHYALVDFDTVTALIDEVGGVTVDVPFEIYDPEYPDDSFGFDPLYIAAGTQEMDGTLALKYMRTRHGDSDFGRAGRQQQVLMALRERVRELGVTETLRRTPTFLQEVRAGLITDLSTGDIVALANAAFQISSYQIEMVVLDYTYVRAATTTGGGSVVILRPEETAPLISRLFN